jgi:hypothetical protein
MNIINNSQVLGSLSKDLVLNTLGKVYVRAGNRYYELDFQQKIASSSVDAVQENDIVVPEIKESDILIVDTISKKDYPGDNKLIITKSGRFYLTTNGSFKNITPSATETDQTSIKINEIDDASVIGQLHSNNLVLDFERGDITAYNGKFNTITVDTLNAKNTLVNSEDRFIQGSGKLYIGPELTID